MDQVKVAIVEAGLGLAVAVAWVVAAMGLAGTLPTVSPPPFPQTSTATSCSTCRLVAQARVGLSLASFAMSPLPVPLW